MRRSRDGCAEQHAERERPAFVESRENQEHENERESEDRDWWNTLGSFLFLNEMPK